MFRFPTVVMSNLDEFEGYLVYYINNKIQWSKICDAFECIDEIVDIINQYITDFSYDQINWNKKNNDDVFIIQFFGIETHKWRFIIRGG